MSLLETYKRKLEIQIQEHKAHLELLKAKARQAAAQSQIELARADKHMAKVRARFKELKGASGSALQDIRGGLKKALTDLTVSTKKAARHFNGPPPAKPRARTRSTKTHGR